MQVKKTNSAKRASSSLIFAISLGAFSCFCNLYLFQPILVLLSKEYTVPATTINWVLAAGTLGLSIGLLPWAMLSEKISRKKVMLITLYTLPLLNFITASLDSLTSLILLRMLTGFMLAGYVGVASAYIAEELSPKLFIGAIAGYVSANSLGGICGRLYGGILTEYFSWQTCVGALGLMSLLIAIYVHASMPKKQHFQKTQAPFLIQMKQTFSHLKQPQLSIAMLIGGVNFAIFVNLYSVMGFRLTEPPFSLPVSMTSLIFLCYLTGTLSARLTQLWQTRFSPISGLFVGTSIAMTGMFITSIDTLITCIIGLLLISFGAFFTHAIAYAWVTSHAKRAKASASALYLIHYYLGGSLGGFILLNCWESFKWQGVTLSASILFALLFILIIKLKQSMPALEKKRAKIGA